MEYSGVGFKAYCANYFTQPGIELAIRLKNQYGIDPDEIDSVEFGTFAETIQHAGELVPPADVLSAQYSAPFVIALAFQYGEVGFDQYTESNLTDDTLLALAEKVNLYVDEQAEEEYQKPDTGLSHSAKMTVTLNDGDEYTKRIQSSQIKGNLGNQLTDQELSQKATRLTEPVIGNQDADKLIRAIYNIEAVSSVNELTELLIA